MIIKENYLNSEFKSMSIRHLDVSETNIVAFAMQYKGFGEKLYPLVGICDLFNDIQLFDVPVEILYRMQNYCGSICFDLSDLNSRETASIAPLVLLMLFIGIYPNYIESFVPFRSFLQYNTILGRN